MKTTKENLARFYADLRSELGQGPIRIEAAARLMAFKKPKADELLQNETKLSSAIDILNKWLFENTDKGVEKALGDLDKMFEYKPYTKKLYRAFPMPVAVSKLAKVGETYTLPTGKSAVQSWTTSEEAAKAFIEGQDYKNANYGIFLLVEQAGHQLSNFKWLTQVVDYVIKATDKSDDLYEIHLDAKKLKRFLEQYEAEQEVIIKMPPKSKVKLVYKY